MGLCDGKEIFWWNALARLVFWCFQLGRKVCSSHSDLQTMKHLFKSFILNVFFSTLVEFLIVTLFHWLRVNVFFAVKPSDSFAGESTKSIFQSCGSPKNWHEPLGPLWKFEGTVSLVIAVGSGLYCQLLSRSLGYNDQAPPKMDLCLGPTFEHPVRRSCKS